jgi:hypothetical protein
MVFSKRQQLQKECSFKTTAAIKSKMAASTRRQLQKMAASSCKKHLKETPTSKKTEASKRVQL